MAVCEIPSSPANQRSPALDGRSIAEEQGMTLPTLVLLDVAAAKR
jgi:hypothetical protein